MGKPIKQALLTLAL